MDKNKILDKLVSNKVLLKRIGIGIVVVVLAIIIINLFVNDSFVSGVLNRDASKIEKEYEKLNGVKSDDGKVYLDVNIPSSNVMTYVNADEVVKIFNDKLDGVIYMGYATCAYCRTAIQILNDTAKDTELDKIYYLDVDKLNDDDKKKVMDVLDEKFYTNKKDDIYVPLVLFVADGAVVSHNKGTLFSQKDPYKEMDASQKQGLSEIYRYGIRDVLNAMKNNNK